MPSERAGSTTHALAQEAVREVGLCGEINPPDTSICILYENHRGVHGWDRKPQCRNGIDGRADCFRFYRHGGPSPWTCPECKTEWIVRDRKWEVVDV